MNAIVGLDVRVRRDVANLGHHELGLRLRHELEECLCAFEVLGVGAQEDVLGAEEGGELAVGQGDRVGDRDVLRTQGLDVVAGAPRGR